MKTNINYKDDRVINAINVMEKNVKQALIYTDKIANATCSILYPLKGDRFEQIGTCVVVRIKSEYFLFTASHIFDEFGDFQIVIGIQGERDIFPLLGERFSSPRGEFLSHKDDSIDATVYHIQDKLPKALKKIALNFTDLDLTDSPYSKFVHIAFGYRIKKSNTSNKQIKTLLEAFPTLEYDKNIYSLLELDSQMHLALAYENQIRINGNWQTSPKPKGISGGSIVKVDGISYNPRYLKESTKKTKALLSAITIGQRREKHKKSGVLIGTRVWVHLTLIDKFMPGLIKYKNETN